MLNSTIVYAGPNKIKIDSSTRLYIEEQLENSGSPWHYATYSNEQITLLKQVSDALTF